MYIHLCRYSYLCRCICAYVAEVHEAVVALRLTQAALRDADETAEASGLGRQIDGLEAEEASELKGAGLTTICS